MYVLFFHFYVYVYLVFLVSFFVHGDNRDMINSSFKDGILHAIQQTLLVIRLMKRSFSTTIQRMKGGSKKALVEEIPCYEIEHRDGLTIRRVKPMIQQFETFAKGRWLGREILEVVSKEFGGHTVDYWLTAFKHGHIRINGHPVTATYRFQNSDRFLHRTHRHEPLVQGDITFVAESPEYFAVCKPSSMPVHPCGAYRYNSLENILKYEPLTPTQPAQLHVVHRLDKVTSGLVIFAKSQEAAAKISKEIRDKTTEKRYLARVKGRFPENLLRLLHPLDSEHIVDITSVVNGEGDDDAVADNTGKLNNKNSRSDNNRKRTLDENENDTQQPQQPQNDTQINGRKDSVGDSHAAVEGSATTVTWEEKKRQRKERFTSSQSTPSTSTPSLSLSSTISTSASTSATTAGVSTQQPPANNNNSSRFVKHNKDGEGKGADVCLSRTAPPLEDVRTHVAVGYYCCPEGDCNTADKDCDTADKDCDTPAAAAERWFYVQCPLDVVSRRDGIHACVAPPQGRVSVTKLRFRSYDTDSDTSLIECQPVTGRTHQIRLHCQLAGHAIANDPCYGGDLFYRDTRKQQLCREAQRLMQESGVVPVSRVLHHSSGDTPSTNTPSNTTSNTTSANTTSNTPSNTNTTSNTTSLNPTLPTSLHTSVVFEEVQKKPGEDDDAFLARSCRYCVALARSPVLRDTEVHLHCDGIWLHAWKYAKHSTSNMSSNNKDETDAFWSFETPLPLWATDSFATTTTTTAAVAGESR